MHSYAFCLFLHTCISTKRNNVIVFLHTKLISMYSHNNSEHTYNNNASHNNMWKGIQVHSTGRYIWPAIIFRILFCHHMHILLLFHQINISRVVVRSFHHIMSLPFKISMCDIPGLWSVKYCVILLKLE